MRVQIVAQANGPIALSTEFTHTKEGNSIIPPKAPGQYLLRRALDVVTREHCKASC